MVFLDVDGVIANVRTNYSYFDPECIRRLNVILKEADAHVVVTSTWRRGETVDSLKTLFLGGGKRYKSHGVPDPEPFDTRRVIGMTPNLSACEDFRRKAGLSWGRGQEITEWMRTYEGGIDGYVVLDDDIDDIAPHGGRLVRTDSRLGLTDSDVSAVLRIIVKPSDFDPNLIEEDLYREILRATPIACVDVAVIYCGMVLLVKRADKPAQGQWWLPGGRVMKGETMKEAAARKVKEELGLDCVVGPLVHTAETIFPDGPGGIDVHSINACFLVYPKFEEWVGSTTDAITLDSHHTEVTETSKIMSSLHPYVKDCLKACGLPEGK